MLHLQSQWNPRTFSFTLQIMWHRTSKTRKGYKENGAIGLSYPPFLLMILVQDFMLVKNHIEIWVWRSSEMKLITSRLSNTIKSAIISKGCVCYIFASLFFMFKKEHLRNKEKCFLFHFKGLFIFEIIKF